MTGQQPEQPAGPDLFEAWARLRTALDHPDTSTTAVYATGHPTVTVRVDDLRAALDAPGDHALTDPAVRRALTAYWTKLGVREQRFSTTSAHGRAMRLAIAAALHLTTDKPETVPDA